jgi:hypothetical protein
MTREREEKRRQRINERWLEAKDECDHPWHRGRCWFGEARVRFPGTPAPLSSSPSPSSSSSLSSSSSSAAAVSSAFELETHYFRTYERPFMESLLSSANLTPNDVIVFSIGVFYRQQIALFMTHMEDLFALLDEVAFPGTLFLREYSPSHFQYSVDGSYTAGRANDTCGVVDEYMQYRLYHHATIDLISRCRKGMPIAGRVLKSVARVFSHHVHCTLVRPRCARTTLTIIQLQL